MQIRCLVSLNHSMVVSHLREDNVIEINKCYDHSDLCYFTGIIKF